jgi:hypothetical protein
MSSLRRRVLLLALLVPGILPAQKAPSKPQKAAAAAIGLSTAGLAGQMVTVLPLTMVVSDPRVPGTAGPKARAGILRWADSLFNDALLERAPEVDWVFPPALRRATTRSGGLLPSPDRMGQSVMRSSNLKETPDPLRGYVRQLVALAGGARFALIPAAMWITPTQSDTLVVELSAVLTDARTGRVMWRTLAAGKGETMADAYHAALATILAADGTPPAP